MNSIHLSPMQLLTLPYLPNFPSKIPRRRTQIQVSHTSANKVGRPIKVTLPLRPPLPRPVTDGVSPGQH